MLSRFNSQKTISVDLSSQDSMLHAISEFSAMLTAIGDPPDENPKYVEKYKVEITGEFVLPQDVQTLITEITDKNKRDRYRYVDDETRLFLAASCHDNVVAKVAELAQSVLRRNQKAGKYRTLWRDNQTPFAQDAMWALTLRDKKYIALYVEYLRTLDLNHEMDQYFQIADIIRRYGWISETYALAAARVMLPSQHGASQIGDMFRGKLDSPEFTALQSALDEEEVDDIHMEIFMESANEPPDDVEFE